MKLTIDELGKDDISGRAKKETAERPRVLFVDDSVVLRRTLKEMFGSDAGLEAFTAAPDPEVVLLNILKTRPHVIVIDADGDWKQVSSLLTSVRSRHPELRVALITADPLAKGQLADKGRSFGVSECWVKTNGFRNPDAAIRRYIQEQTAAITGVTAPKPAAAAPSVAHPRGTAGKSFARSGKKTAVVIGVSTGGPEALSVLLPMLPPDLSVPVLIVQHMLAAFTSLLAERLAKKALMPVFEGRDGMAVKSGQILIAPGNRHMELTLSNGEVFVALNEGPPENSCRPAVDPLFRSAAKIYGPRALGVILTGMGQDGLIGARILKQAGGTIVAQDQASSTVWGMPGQVVGAGLADIVLDLKDIAGEIMQKTAYKAKGVLQA